MSNRVEVLATVVTAEQALEWVVETTLKAEVNHTETNSETRTLADYLADIERVVGRILEGDGYDELVPITVRSKDPTDPDDCYTNEPTHVRLYFEQDEWWIDGADNSLRYTVDVQTYETREEALAAIPEFIEFLAKNCNVVWMWDSNRKTRLRIKDQAITEP